MATQQSSQEGTSQTNDLGLSSIFDYEELQEATKFFNPSQVIGEGGFGVVYRGMLKDGRAVAVKELTVPHKQRMEQFFNEARVLSKLHQTNLVTLYGCTNPKDKKMLLVYEFVPNGTLADHLQRRRFSKEILTWRQRLRIAVETAEALTYLHSLEPPLIHRDVKTENILLDNNFNVKVADFGMCRHLPPSGAHISTMPQGTQGYLDPEYNQLYKLTVKSDVFSFGVVMIELISGKAVLDPERGDDEIWLVRMAFNKMKNGQLDQLVDLELGYQDDSEVFHMINSVAQLAYQCLQPTGVRRPLMIDVLRSLKTISDYRYPVSWDKPERRIIYRRTLMVCVTGADGYVGSLLVKLLLQRGYTVKGTVRNPDSAKSDHLRTLYGAMDRLMLFKAHMFDYDALRGAIDGCVGVFDAIYVTDDPELMVESTVVNWTRYLINAAADAGVRRVVYTSSIAAVVVNPNRRPGVVIDESCWSDPDFCQKTKQWYAYGKVVAEQAAWETAGNRGLHLLVVCAADVIGPLLQPGISDGNAYILKYVDGSPRTHVNAIKNFVDVRDVAEALVLVYEAPKAKGRYLCAESVLYDADILRILAKLFPRYPYLASRCSDELKQQEQPYKFSNQKLRDLGLKFHPTIHCFYDIVKSLQQKGYLPIINYT